MAECEDASAITVAPTERGFMLGEFIDRYGQTCSIQESSLATESCIRLGTMPNRMHLTRGMAAALLPLLQHFVEMGDLRIHPPGTEAPTAPAQPQAERKVRGPEWPTNHDGYREIFTAAVAAAIGRGETPDDAVRIGDEVVTASRCMNWLPPTDGGDRG